MGRDALLGVTVVDKRQRATDNVRSSGVEICRKPSQSNGAARPVCLRESGWSNSPGQPN